MRSHVHFFFCVHVHMQNPIIMDIPVELPQVKVKVVQFTPRGKLADHKRTEVKDIDAYMVCAATMYALKG